MGRNMGRRFCTQLSVDATGWPSDMLGHALLDGKGNYLTAAEARCELNRLRACGYEVVPCGCPGSSKAPGRCPGTAVEDKV